MIGWRARYAEEKLERTGRPHSTDCKSSRTNLSPETNLGSHNNNYISPFSDLSDIFLSLPRKQLLFIEKKSGLFRLAFSSLLQSSNKIDIFFFHQVGFLVLLNLRRIFWSSSMLCGFGMSWIFHKGYSMIYKMK